MRRKTVKLPGSRLPRREPGHGLDQDLAALVRWHALKRALPEFFPACEHSAPVARPSLGRSCAFAAKPGEPGLPGQRDMPGARRGNRRNPGGTRPGLLGRGRGTEGRHPGVTWCPIPALACPTGRGKVARVMPARDAYHDQVRHALERDGWTITHDPLRLKVRRRKLYVDLGAERFLAAEKRASKNRDRDQDLQRALRCPRSRGCRRTVRAVRARPPA